MCLLYQCLQLFHTVGIQNGYIMLFLGISLQVVQFIVSLLRGIDLQRDQFPIILNDCLRTLFFIEFIVQIIMFGLFQPFQYRQIRNAVYIMGSGNACYITNSRQKIPKCGNMLVPLPGAIIPGILQ